MKNQYFGDVGDFGKYGLLTALSGGSLRLGVNWYLTKDDTKPDGKYIEYLAKSEFKICDPELHSFLSSCIKENHRNVSEIKKLERFINTPFYEEILHVADINALSESGRRAREKKREDWFSSSLDKLSGCDLIFCDPDNGIETRSLSRVGKDSIKYVFKSEISRMIDNGFSLIIYNHSDRNQEADRIARFKDISNTLEMRVLRFKSYSSRYYIILMQPRHTEVINRKLNEFLANVHWSKHSLEIEI